MTDADESRPPAPRATSPLDPRARAVADRLHARSTRQTRASLAAMLTKAVRSRLREGSWDMTQSAENKTWLADKLVALDPHKAALCYQLCRAIGARRVVEAGTSYGVSTIYLAAAVRDNMADDPDGTPPRDGLVIGTEHEPAKVAAAHATLTEAGLDGYVEIREGDLRRSLRDLDGPIDFMLVDIWIPMALPALRSVTPALRRGALVVCDNVDAGRKQYADYLSYVRDPAGPFTSITIPGHGGLEISLKN
ncbi:putative O-methyltransferase [Nocardia nova SH22a]|uniref:Putative O-methyltransferase n=1 Tax=Nocardia nova SH22a TaxID=1415166 RepID=W5TJT9_9NOCA|nr:class I SAM-dependent methyltransferase [Nocardia nova]AHH19482.1 putative O-methyltransferase [Nocardia nova SH22a]